MTTRKMTSDDIFKAIGIIRETKGTNAKKAKLAMFPDMQNLLRTTYSPYIHFNVTVSPRDVGAVLGNGTRQFDEETDSLLMQLATGMLTGARAKRELDQHLKELTWGSAQLLTMVINKSFDFGLGAKGINDVFPLCVPTFPIQLAQPFSMNNAKFPCLGQPKLDGLRAIYRDGELRSRKGHLFMGLERLTDAIYKVLAHSDIEDFTLDGELIIDGVHFDEISGKIRAFKPTDNVEYHVFDIVTGSSDMLDRMECLQRWLQPGIAATRAHDFVKLVPWYPVNSYEDALRLYEQMVNAGYEGAMLKDPRALYEDRRSYAWMKLKPKHTLDLRVVGIFEGQGKYAGMCGGLIVYHNGVNVRVGSGLSDTQRLAWYTDEDLVVGSLAEVAFQEVTPNGSLRFPRLVRLRGDK